MPPADGLHEPRTVVPGSLVPREVALLLVLSLASVGLFLITQRLAEWEEARVEREAAVWFSRGQALVEAGDGVGAAAALRRAVLADRSNLPYGLALARALTDAGRDDEASALLRRLRELAPDNALVHYRLAHLHARAGNVDQATRHYYLALYSPDAEPLEGGRRSVGLELAAYLIDHADVERASDVLGAVARDATGDAATQLDVARLFERAGNQQQALRHYAAASDLEPASLPAATGAGRVALSLHDYAQAEAFLRRAVAAGSDEDRDRLELVVAVRRLDPLAPGLTSRARAARLADALVWADRSIAACDSMANAAGNTHTSDIRTFRRTYTPADMRDADVLEAGTALVVDAASGLRAACPDVDPTVAAVWRVIGNRPGAAS